MPLCGTCHNLVTKGFVEIDPRSRQGAVTLSGVFERGPKAAAPSFSVEREITAMAQQLADVWELRSPRPLLLLQDGVSGAFYVECHIAAAALASGLDFDTVIDPAAGEQEPQSSEDAQEDPELEQYRFNRRLSETSDVFQRLVADAKGGRPFSDLILEWNTSYTAERPLKVLGGQHRGVAISRAVADGVELDRLHEVRIYFGLSTAQRVELVVIANSNISIPNPLLDRIAEHQLGNRSREWCQRVGLLAPGADFTDRVAGENRMTVQLMRAFVTNYIRGTDFEGNSDTTFFSELRIPRTGSFEPDADYIKELQRHPLIWDDPQFEAAGRQFARLNETQIAASREAPNVELRQVALRYKAMQPTVASSWAFVAGMLRSQPDRLQLLYRLPENYDKRASRDPLNALAMSRHKHVSDPPTYRGLGTRQNQSEAQKLAEVFRLVSDPEFDNYVSTQLITTAVMEYHSKKAAHEAAEQRRLAQRVRNQIQPES